MPKLIRNFVQGKMNKDLDDRLVPAGQYRDALNIQIATSEGSDVGAIQNIVGNTKQALKASGQYWANNFGLNNQIYPMGIYKDTLNNKIYYFITEVQCRAIMEYDITTGYTVPVVIDKRGSTDRVLTFNVNYPVIGINILDGMLFWTDNYTEPKKINIEQWKAATAASNTGTTLNNTTQIYGRDFIESDVTVIKPSPKQAVSVSAKSTKTAANPERGVGITPAFADAKLTNSDGFALVPGNTVSISLSGYISPSSVFDGEDVILTHTETQSDGTQIEYECVGTLSNLTAGEVPGQINGGTLTIISVSPNVPDTVLEWEMVLIETEPIFKNDFPRFSYRWKYKDGEYSTYAPFSEAAFVPGRFSYDPKNGFNLGMNDNIRKITLTFPTDTYALPPADVEEIEILYKGVGSENVYVIDTHLISDGTLSTFVIEKDLLGPVIESLQLLRPWDNVPRLAKAQEIIGNRVVYGNYLQNYSMPSLPTISATTTGTSFTTTEDFYKHGKKSVKSDRTYQIGVTFIDAFNRESPVFTNKDAAVSVDIKDALKKNVLSASTSITSAPSWAEYYKYYVKETSPEFYNVVLDRFYDADDGNIWLSFPSAERNKIQTGDFLILKKQHGTHESVYLNNRYKVLDVKNEAPSFIKKVNKAIARAQIHAKVSNNPTVKGFEYEDNNSRIVFKGPVESTHSGFFNAFTGSCSIQFQSADGKQTSAIYKISSGGPLGNSAQDYELKFENRLGLNTDDTWLLALADNDHLNAIVYDNTNEDLPEFQGKFFVKVPKKASFQKDIAAESGNSIYTTIEASTIYMEDDMPSPSTSGGAKIAYGNTAVGDANNGPDDGTQTFDVHLFTGWVDDDNASNAKDWATSTKSKTFDAINIGAKVRFVNSNGDEGGIYTVLAVTESTYYDNQNGYNFNYSKKVVTVDRDFADSIGNDPVEMQIVLVSEGSVNATPNPAVFETEPIELADLDIYYEATDALEISGLANSVDLDFTNCYTFGNGVESDRIRDDFNAPLLGKGVRVSTVLKTPYKEERKGSSLIFSGIVNSVSGVNNSNQFTTAINITKDLPNTYGKIQKLHARDTDLIALCEDKCFKILANKDALFNADGNTNITASNNVLGQTIPFAGEFGISQNPETFASYGFRAYFADKARGVVLRLSRDGLTEISSKGMSDYFEDKFKTHTGKIAGSYDENTGAYNIHFVGDESVSFKENVDGWTTRLTYAPRFATSIDSEYYTIDSGFVYKHDNTQRNFFYGYGTQSKIKFIFNDAPDKIKTFKTLSYHGDSGWTATVTGSLNKGEVNTWSLKEGLYFNFIKGIATTWANGSQIGNLDLKEFNVQGIGEISEAPALANDVWTITFADTLNVSMQAKGDGTQTGDQGDKLFVAQGTDEIQVGEILSIVGNTITVSDDYGATPADGDYAFFVKDREINTSGISGFVAEVEMSLESTERNKKELFMANSETFISSE